MLRLRFALLGSVLAFALSAISVLAQWPTSCVEANDAFEQYIGNHQNVGIYQRVFGNAAAAEAACRRDHRADVRAAFWWAVQGVDRAPEPAESPAPQPTASPTPVAVESSHPEFERVRGIAVARGADAVTAATVADQVTRAGDTRAYIRGTASGWSFGEYDCYIYSWSLSSNRGPACPWVGIDDGLTEAWDLLHTLDIQAVLGEVGLDHWSWGAASATLITWDELDGLYGLFNGGGNHITIDRQRFRLAPTWMVATLLAHELSHAMIPRWQTDDSYNDCLWNELLAFSTELMIGSKLVERYPASGGYALDLYRMAQVFTEQGTQGIQRGWDLNWDKDLSEWPIVIHYLETERRYAKHCRR